MCNLLGRADRGRDDAMRPSLLHGLHRVVDARRAGTSSLYHSHCYIIVTMKGGADTQRVQHANATEGKRCVLCRVSIKNWVCAYMYWKPVFYAYIYELS